MTNRKHISDNRYRLKSMKDDVVRMKFTIVTALGEEQYQQMLLQYDAAIEFMDNEFAKYPIGHRYTGEYYVKVPYSSPPEYEKRSEPMFMRCDLVSWQKDEARLQGRPPEYVRAIFKSPKDSDEISREDAEPVFTD